MVDQNFEDSNLAQCNYVRATKDSSKCRPNDLFKVSFGVEDARASNFPYEDALVIILEVVNFTI